MAQELDLTTGPLCAKTRRAVDTQEARMSRDREKPHCINGLWACIMGLKPSKGEGNNVRSHGLRVGISSTTLLVLVQLMYARLLPTSTSKLQT